MYGRRARENPGILQHLRDLLFRSSTGADEQEQIQLIDRVGASGSYEAVPLLLDWVFGRDSKLADAAAGSIEQVVARCTNDELVRLDQLLRHRDDWQWDLVDPSNVFRLARGLTRVVGLIASHRNGYVREAAVRLLDQVGDGSELPFLLIRLNDWVPQVRQAAKQAVLDRVRFDYVSHLARHLPLVHRLQFQGRELHRDLIEAILRLLRSPQSHPTLLTLIAHDERAVRRLSFGLLAEAVANPESIIAGGLASKDEVIRLRAAQVARQRLHLDTLEPVLSRTLCDRFMPIRREAVTGYMERLPEKAPAVLQRTLLDSHVCMREVARFYLRQRGGFDFAAFYRSKVAGSEGHLRATAISGLGETGAAEDLNRVAARLNDPDARVRRAAVRALGGLDVKHQHLEAFLSAFGDPSAAVAKAARDVLRPRIYSVSADKLWSIFTATAHPHVRRAVLTLIPSLTWWDGAPILVLATASDDEKLRLAALDYLGRWSRNPNRLSVRPTPDQLQRLEQATGQNRGKLGQHILDDIAAHLLYARRQWA